MSDKNKIIENKNFLDYYIYIRFIKRIITNICISKFFLTFLSNRLNEANTKIYKNIYVSLNFSFRMQKQDRYKIHHAGRK